MRYRLTLLVFLLTACGADTAAPPLPTAHIIAAARTATLAARRMPLIAPSLDVPTPSATAATQLDQYRAWMEAARDRHPYNESVDTMWNLMICESSGNPDTVEGPYHGLFQYTSDAWAGDWNPYRDSPILDPRAQIFATAKAWHDGNQAWWGCYHG